MAPESGLRFGAHALEEETRLEARQKLALAASLAAAVVAVVAAAAQAAASASPYKVGIIYCGTGPLAEYGSEYIEGLKLGLKYATKGTNTVNGHPIQVNVQDETATPATAVSEAKDLIGHGYKIIGGSCSSAVAIQIAPLAAQNKVLYISGAGWSAQRISTTPGT